jgi:hypothetical protein
VAGITRHLTARNAVIFGAACRDCPLRGRCTTAKARRLKLRYRGTARNHAWLKHRTAALNLRNLPGKGLTRRGDPWALAT